MSKPRHQVQFIASRFFKQHFPPFVGWKFCIAVFMVVFLGLVSRRPDAILNPQFWAEDGIVFYEEAYHLNPLSTLLLPYAGYVNFVPRLAAAFSQLFPLSWAPLIFSLIALVIQALPVNFILSQRFSELIPDYRTSLILACLYVGIPNCFEIHATLTNIQWYLAVLGFMVVVAKPSHSPVWRVFDSVIMGLFALTGPFSIFLFPLAAVYRQQTGEKRRKGNLKALPFYLWILLMGAFIQSLVILNTAAVGTRSLVSAKPTFLQFTQLISGQIFFGTLIGWNGYRSIYSASWFTLASVVTAVVVLFFVLYCLLNGPIEIKLLIIFATVTFSACLIGVSWKTIWLPGGAGRYSFIPTIALLVSLLWSLSKQNPNWIRAFAAVCLSLTLMVGVVLDWRQTPRSDYHFQTYAQIFGMLPKGSVLLIPTPPNNPNDPNSDDWVMRLKKR